eukprot:gene3795-6956_t
MIIGHVYHGKSALQDTLVQSSGIITENKKKRNFILEKDISDFSTKGITSSLHTSDGALVVLDVVEGFCMNTEGDLRFAMIEHLTPVLMLNKIDRYFIDLNLELEEMYQNFVRAIESVNEVISKYEDNYFSKKM